jgi:hypothetical protein
MDSWLSTFSIIARCSCVTHIDNGTMGLQALGDDAAVCKNVRMVEDEDIVIRGKVKDQYKENTSGRR